MCKVRQLRTLVNQRLSEAAEEILGLVERTIAEYQEELGRSREENERHRRLVDTLSNCTVSADSQQLASNKEEQQVWSCNIEDHEASQSVHIKVEEQNLWSSQDKDFAEFSLPCGGDDDELLQCGPCEEDREAQFQTQQVKAETQEGGPEPYIHLDLGPLLQADNATSDSSDEALRSNADNKGFQCAECGKTLASRPSLKRHLKRHTGEKPFSCSFCDKKFTERSDLVVHGRSHTGVKPFACTLCCWKFSKKSSLVLHMRRHTGEKPHVCSVCGKRFRHRCTLVEHSRLHVQGNTYSCSLCGASFTGKRSLAEHRRTHAAEQTLCCSVCAQTVSGESCLKLHMETHAGGDQTSV
nr:zinc finger protein 771-like [Nerophis lumbriciformis]